MALVTLRDLTTNEDIDVPPEGYIFGRAGGDADIQLEDNSISRRQARVSLKGGMWLLETLAVPQGQRPPRPVQLEEGATFAVGQSEFEVVRVEAEDEPEPDPGAKTIAPQKGKPAPAPATPAKKAPATSSAKPTTSPPRKTTTVAADEAASDEAPAKGFGAMFVAVPRAVAYYLLNVPKMLVNPIGTVRKTIEEQPNEPMGRIELIGYALPALLATGMLGSIATGLAALIGPGHVFLLMSFIPIPAVIGGFIGAIVVGFIFHPVLTWVITRLKGESDARSRTNYFLQTMTLSIILAVPNAIGLILGALPIPFISLLGPLLSVAASLVSFYVTIQWFEHFKVVKWVKTVLLVLGALTVLGAAYGLVMGVVHTIQGFGTGGGDSAQVAAGAAEGDETGLAPPALEEMPTDPEEAKAWAKKRADAASARAQADAQKLQVDAKEKPDEATPPPAKGKETPPEPKKTLEAKPPEEKPEPVAVKEPPPPAKEEPVAQASGAYGAFAHRRDSIEKLFESDPTVLAKSPELQKLYGAYLEASYDLDKKWGKDTAKNPEHAKLNARLREAELFQKTGKIIDSLGSKLGVK